MLNDKEFRAFQEGIFKIYFEKYIEFKRGKGEKVTRSTLIRLKTLNQELTLACDSLEISREVAEFILREREKESPASRGLRISDFRQFSAFLRSLGITSYEIPRKYMKKVYVPFRPYIFSEAELGSITRVADQLRQGIRSQTHRLVYPVIIRVLIGTGMRIGEVLSLKIQDVDMANQLLIVYKSKNNVSRYVPMSESLSATIAKYLSRIQNRNEPQQHLFISPYTGTGYSYDAMKYMFKKIFSIAGIRTPQGRLPRIHDIRHSFCTASLNRMLESGMNLYTAVPILAAYVGHVNLSDTERYIHLTEHGYSDFITKESRLGSLIPEVCDEN
ncbi:tyrosine-type recombinase/integrase [Virgibacillus sp. W0181]|uniref:tyrosine-type recombinase/integrase n=1 Tax=Virgibacillus sp. W0181 TaxID=3391581 RepID=UPI003F4855C8